MGVEHPDVESNELNKWSEKEQDSGTTELQPHGYLNRQLDF